MAKIELKDSIGRVLAIIEDYGAFKLDKKQHLFMLLFNEYEKDIPRFKDLIKECNFDAVTFRVALEKLVNEGLIGGVSFERWTSVNGISDLPGLFITKDGYEYAAKLIQRYNEATCEIMEPKESEIEKELNSLKVYSTEFKKKYENLKKEYADYSTNCIKLEEENCKLKEQVRGLRYAIKNIAVQL